MKLVVTTKARGVFFGEADDETSDPMTLRDCRMAVYWSRDVKGVVGLAATGPTNRCRITKAASEITLRGITATMHCTTAAIAAWEREPWSA